MVTRKVPVTRVAISSHDSGDDVVAIEEPLEIRAAWDGREKNVAVTMRTPGDDFDLAAGFLFTEGLIRAGEEIESVRHWGSPNTVRVALHPHARLDTAKLDRNFYMTSSCGVCGKASIDAVRVVTTPIAGARPVAARVIRELPHLLESAQPGFRATGGVHGAAIADRDGNLLRTREDVGRHNAVDKAIGSFVRESATPLADTILIVTSRAGFEIVQKAAMASIPTLVSIGPPTSLAIDLARELGLTLIGFAREERFTVYSGSIV